MYMQLFIQSYQCIIGTLLLLFIPQACGKDNTRACLFHEAMARDETVHGLALVINFATLLCFIVLYVVEYIREECLIDYLDTNPDCTATGVDVLARLKKGMPAVAIKEIEKKSRNYVLAFRLAAAAFILNCAVSFYVCVINHPLPGLTTKTTFLTSVLYVVIKLSSVFMTTMADEGEYHSGYIRIRMQFNDIDRDHWTNYKQPTEEDKQGNQLVASSTPHHNYGSTDTATEEGTELVRHVYARIPNTTTTMNE